MLLIIRRSLAGAMALALSIVTLSAAVGAEKAARIDELISRYHEYGVFNGTALVADHGEVIYKKGFGMANFEWGIPNTPDVRFRLGSISKQFTAALILRLLAEGKIDLQAHISDYVPEYPKATASKVTIHHLLTHTSGIPTYTSMPGFWEDLSRDPKEPLAFIELFSGKDLEFEPGSRFSYNNSAYYLLGVIIEKVTGQSYEQALRERFFEPLEMQGTGYDRHKVILAKRAGAYGRGPEGVWNADYVDMSIAYSAGGLYSTVEDLYRWDQALYTDQVLAAKQRELLFTPYFEMPGQEPQAKYAYGWVIREIAKPGQENRPGGSEPAEKIRLVGHGGGINGFSTLIERIPAEKHFTALLNNTGGTRLGEMAEGIRAILYGADAKMPKRPISKVLYETYQREGITAAVKRFGDLKEKDPDAYDFGWTELRALGQALSRAKKTADHVKVCELNAASYPGEWNVHLDLADAYKEAGEKQPAIRSYAKALELNPDGAEMITERLKELSGSGDHSN